MSTAAVAVVIGNYNGARFLAGCLESLAAQTRHVALTVVADAGSTDDSRTIAMAHGARFLACENRGLGFLYNRGVAAVRTDYVLVANSDVLFDPNCVERLAAALDADPIRLAADPSQLSWDGARRIHGLVTMRRGRLLDSTIPGVAVDANAHATGTTETVAANAGAMLVRRQHLLSLGGFDEALFLEYEDVDLCWRGWLRGLASVYVPDACVRHFVGGLTGAADAPRRLTASHHSMLRFALKCLPATAAARVVAVEALRAARSPRVVGPALARILAELPELVRERRRLRPSRVVYARLVA